MIEVVVPEYSMHHPLGTENTSPILQCLKCHDTLDLSTLARFFGHILVQDIEYPD
jgi:hypothetical protein